MKIIGGKFKGRNFFRPADIKPTQNIVRKAIFDLIGQELTGYRVLDLFSGSGAIGLEAVSRGAKEVYFVENDQKYSTVIKENIELFGFNTTEDNQVYYEVLACDSFQAIKHLFGKKIRFDLIVCDPPYGRGLAKKALKLLEAYDIVHPNSFVVIEHHKREILPETLGRFCIFRQKKYGSSLLSVYNT